MSILLQQKHHVMRSPVNPLDKSTIVSILPIPIHDRKLTLDPSRFDIAPGSFETPSILVIGPSSWWREVDENQPLLEIPVSSVVMAESIVRDYIAGMLLCNMEDKKPGLFFVPGELTLEQIKKNYAQKLIDVRNKQNNWFKSLVDMADGLFARTGGNPLAIDSLMRLAAVELKMLDKPWLKNNLQPVNLVSCPACTMAISSLAVICPNCRVIIDNEKFQKLGMKFTG